MNKMILFLTFLISSSCTQFYAALDFIDKVSYGVMKEGKLEPSIDITDRVTKDMFNEVGFGHKMSIFSYTKNVGKSVLLVKDNDATMGYSIDDPAPGIAKILQIQFKDKDGHPQVINLNENEIFIIAPNEILKAASLPTSFINGAVYRADKAPVKVTDILNANIGKKIQITNDFFKKYTPSFDAGSKGLLSIWFKDAKGNTPTYYFDEGEELLLTQAKISKPHQKFIIKAEYRETDKETQCVKKSTDVTQIIKNNFRNRIALTAGNFSDKLIKAAPGGTFLIYFINKDGTKQIAQFQDGSVVILTRGSLAWAAKNTDQDAVSHMPTCPVQ